jgi:ATP-dependent protease ClpP protease subunit
MATEKKSKNSEYLTRIITLGEVDDENINDAIGLIHEINKEDNKKAVEKREPIELILNSPGGHVYYGFGIVDAIESSQTPVHILVQVQAMTMALLNG